MNDKLDFLLNQANIGSYTKCEVIEIFAFDKEKKQAFNIYTLIIFENTKQKDIKELLTDKLQQFKGYKSLSWGIQRRVIDIDIAKKLFNELEQKNEFKIDNCLDIGNLKLLSEQYVPPRESMHKAIQINNILKNNFHNGSYILEFFDEEKQNIQFLLDNPQLLNSFSEQISSIIPIKIGTLSDRLGNVIFQFPINIFRINIDISRNLNLNLNLKIEHFIQNKEYELNNTIIRIYEKNDDVITRQKVINVTNKIINIEFDDSFGTHIEIIDKNTSLILYKYKLNIMKQFIINGGMINPQKRVFKLDEEIKKIQVSHRSITNNVLEKEPDKPFDEWIRNRKYEQELKELEESKSFVQYFGKEENKALKDVRWLINNYGDKGVYLWDLFLNAKDIKNTLYFSEKAYVPLKAITGLKHPNENGKQKIKNNIFNELDKDDKEFLFLNLEVRGRIGSHGYEFHDRFIIFPLEQPRVWSLGISVNQLGASHHILQEVKNAQHILNAFDKLWDELSDEECLVWKSN
jgi:hypothetical protein